MIAILDYHIDMKKSLSRARKVEMLIHLSQDRPCSRGHGWRVCVPVGNEWLCLTRCLKARKPKAQKQAESTI